MDNLPSKGPSSREDVNRLAEIILEMQKGCKALDYYQDGHPALFELVTNCFNAITERMESQETVAITVKRRGFFSGYHQIGKAIKPLEPFAKDLYIRGVRKIFVLKGLVATDFETFLRTIHMSPKTLQDGKGVESILAERGVKTVWVNEINYDRLLGKSLDYEGETDEVTDVSSSEDAGANLFSPFALQEDESLESLASEFSGDRQEINLEALLDELTGSISEKRYREIVGLMIPLVLDKVKKEEFELPERVMVTLSQHMDSSSHVLAEKERIILRVLREMALPPMIIYLINRLCAKDNRADPTPVLLKVGEPALDALLDAMAETDDIHSRKLLSRTIEQFGTGGAEKLKERLDDVRWFVVRNVATLLGEIGTQEDISALDALFDHDDVRVRKETIKAISRIGSREAASTLIRRFGSQEKDLQRIITFNLGIMDEPVALPYLLKMAGKKGGFSKEPELRLEAIAALGKLRMADALPALKNVLVPDGMFKREREELRLASAKSIAQIGGEKALDILSGGARSSNSAVKAECEKLTAAMNR